VVRYELLARRKRRWQVDGLVEDKTTAVEKARALLGRDPFVSAVRVVMLENRREGMAERTVCMVTARPSRNGKTAGLSRYLGAGRDEPFVTMARMRRNDNRSRSRREILWAAIVGLAAAGFLWYGLTRPTQPWAFDLPDAQKPHMIRNSLTGAY
jgi:hypothetical protein